MSLKNRQLQARVTEEEQKKMKKLAEESNHKSFTDYITDKIINANIIEFDLKDINERLAKSWR